MSASATRKPHAFSLVEILIVLMLLAILAAIAIPRALKANEDAKESALCTDIQTMRRQIALYTHEHGGLGPHMSPDGPIGFDQIVDRMTGRTDSSGKLDPAGAFGPYIDEWPANPFCDEAIACNIRFGWAAAPPRNGLSGWYYSLTTCIISANSLTGGESLDPE